MLHRIGRVIVIVIVTGLFIYNFVFKYSGYPSELLKDYSFSGFNKNCSCNGENFCFPGLNSDLSTKYGIAFSCDLFKFINEYNLTEKDIQNGPDPTEYLNESNLVIVTLASSNHFMEMRRLIKHSREIYKNITIVVYDIGINQEEIAEIKSWCNVHYRFFDFSRFPPHVKDFNTYAFKVVLLDAFREFRSFFFFDASIRIQPKAVEKIIAGVRKKRLLPYQTYTVTAHSVYFACHPGMYVYLPIPKSITRHVTIQSGIMFVADSKYTRKAMKWFLLCSLTKDCIFPKGANFSCQYENIDLANTYAGCHRPDQAIVNLIQGEHLFGSEGKGAIYLNFTDAMPKTVDDVDKIMEERSRRFLPYSRYFDVNRDEKMYDRLNMTCR